MFRTFSILETHKSSVRRLFVLKSIFLILLGVENVLFVRFTAPTLLTVLGDENVLLNNGRFIVDVSLGPAKSNFRLDAGVIDVVLARNGAVYSFNGVFG